MSDIERFTKKYLVSDTGCWVWQASVDRDGYGNFSIKRKWVSAHRYSYTTHIGPIPDDLVIDHLCKNPSCVNPEHLEAVSQRTNILRGNTIQARRAAITHCPQGHEYTADNTYIDKRNSRHCRACKRERYRVK
jgi:hypothetical protein